MHPKIIPGFTYRVRSLDRDQYLFNGEPTQLLSIGRGYAKRFTFQSKSLNDNQNYFWADSFPSGFAFSLVLIKGDEVFKILNADSKEVGRLQVSSIIHDQTEIIESDAEAMRKQALVSGKCRITLNTGEEYEDVWFTGLAISTKDKRNPAKVTALENVTINNPYLSLNIPLNGLKIVTSNFTQ